MGVVRHWAHHVPIGLRGHPLTLWNMGSQGMVVQLLPIVPVLVEKILAAMDVEVFPSAPPSPGTPVKPAGDRTIRKRDHLKTAEVQRES